MALITTNRDKEHESGESDFTLLLLKHGHARLAESDPHYKPQPQAPAPELSQAPELPEIESTSAPRARSKADVLQTRPVMSPERRYALQTMAERLTGRIKHHDEKSS